MSSVSARDIVHSVAIAYGYSVDLVRAGGPEPISQTERRTRLQARLVAAYLLDRHRTMTAQQIMWELNLQPTRDARDLVKLAKLIPSWLNYDKTLAARVERAEQRIDSEHDQRMREKEQTAKWGGGNEGATA